jgi:hypothetical protein
MTKKRKPGRKTKLTPEVEETILRHLRMGGYRNHAAMAAGIGVSTFEDWMMRGADGEQPFADFRVKVDKALAEDGLRNQSIITRAAVSRVAGDWRAAAYSLEKKFPKDYGHAAIVAAASVSLQPGGGADARSEVTFYLPTNGRRPEDDEAGKP